ncbi:MAG: TadE family protein [Lachnospiraceae bacterium]
MKKGSYTVEAALLMGVLIPLLVGVIYLGFFMMIRGNVQGEAIEKALTALLIGEETEGVSLGEKKFPWKRRRRCRPFPLESVFFLWRIRFRGVLCWNGRNRRKPFSVCTV